jgi:molybdate transport system substrate-binding protein
MTGPLHLLAAGSLARALSGLGSVGDCAVAPLFGASGLLRGWIEQGQDWDVFASADTDHPRTLHRAGLATRPRVFCHNALCLIVRQGLRATSAPALLLREDLTLGISTPGNDPSGDYAVAALQKLDAVQQGAGGAAVARARRLTGAPGLPTPPAGCNAYAWLIGSGAADLFLTYRTNGIAAREETPGLRILDLPDTLQVRATYALTTRMGAGRGAAALAELILSPGVQRRLETLGFQPATLHPAEGSTG